MLSLGEPRTGPLDDEDLLQLEMRVDSKAEKDADWKSVAGARRARGAEVSSSLRASHQQVPIAPKKTEPFTLQSRDNIKEFQDILEGQRLDTVQLPAIPESWPPIHVEPLRPLLVPNEPAVRNAEPRLRLLNNRD
jgi:hypothetical protein